MSEHHLTTTWRWLAEALGLAVFVTFSLGAAALAHLGVLPTLDADALVPGVVILALVYGLSHLSGAHIQAALEARKVRSLKPGSLTLKHRLAGAASSEARAVHDTRLGASYDGALRRQGLSLRASPNLVSETDENVLPSPSTQPVTPA
ncbi:hypothetical protein GCM10022631_13230 [Deinococcus rubellus]|uniref:hypothetical protein n=1 Tax=Deinococcus rubellus TaxID=1889240 RepID=UPI0031EAC85A